MPRGRKKGSKNKPKVVEATKAEDIPTLEELRGMIKMLEAGYKEILHQIRGDLIAALHRIRQLTKVKKYMKDLGLKDL